MRYAFFLLSLLMILPSCGTLPPRQRHSGMLQKNNKGPIPYRQEAKNRYTESSCQEPNDNHRKLLLALASPRNFPRLKYKIGTRNPASSMDCSSFVHHVFNKAGMPYSFRPTQTLKNAPEFDLLPEEMGKPGDLSLFRGHVGIINEDNLVISSTRVRSKYQNSSITVMDRGNFSSFRGQRYVLRYRCMPTKIAAKPAKKTNRKLATKLPTKLVKRYPKNR